MMQDNKEMAETTPTTASTLIGETPPAPQPAPKPLTPAAERALAEAQARRADYDRVEAQMPKERGGRGGNDPVRYGDWEKKGLAIDF